MRGGWRIARYSLLLVVLVAAGCGLVADGEPDGGEAPPDSETGGTLIITVETDPAGQAGSFQFTGVPTGTISANSTLVVTDLEPGTYTSTEVDPAPDFDVTAVRCDDGDSATSSSGDPQTRTAVFNLDPGETVECTFTNAQRGTLVVASRTVPDGATGQFQFTGVPSGTIPANGTLVVANLTPGTYTSTEVDPAPDFDLTAVECDDGRSATTSSGDPQTRSAIFNLDPGEMVQCTFTNARRGTVIVAAEGGNGPFQYTGVPSGTVESGSQLVVSNLPPGTYTTTEVEPDADQELSEVTCDDEASATTSSGDAGTRSAIFNLDAGETVRCVFSHETSTETAGGDTGGGSVGGGDGAGGSGDAINPFDDPENDLADFPLPDDLPPDAGAYLVPKAGPWTAYNFAGQMDCGVTALGIPTSPPETGVIEVLDGGQTVIGSSLGEDQTVPITMSADPEIAGRYAGAISGMEQGVPITINYFWQVVTDEYIVGYLTSTFTAQGVSCTIYRPFELIYAGEE